MKKKILALIVLFAVILGVASCGEKKVKVIPATNFIKNKFEMDFSHCTLKKFDDKKL